MFFAAPSSVNPLAVDIVPIICLTNSLACPLIRCTLILMYSIWCNTLVIIKSLTRALILSTYLPSTALINLCLIPSSPREYSIRTRRSERRFRLIRKISLKPRVLFVGSITYSVSRGCGFMGGKSTKPTQTVFKIISFWLNCEILPIMNQWCFTWCFDSEIQ